MSKKGLVHRTVPDDAYSADWGTTAGQEVPNKKAIFDKIETLGAGGSTTVTANTGTVLSLANINGTLCNLRAADTANANTTFTVSARVAGGWNRTLINTTSEPSITGATKQQGSDWVSGTDMYMDSWSDGTDDYFNFVAINSETGAGPTLFEKFTIPDIVATDDMLLFYTDVAITITKVANAIQGGTNVVWNLTHDTTANSGTPNSVFTSDVTTSSEAGTVTSTGFSDATIPAGSWVRLKTTSVSGTVLFHHLTIVYTED